MRKVEFFHTTDEQVESFIIKAINLVTELDPPSDLREATFIQAVNLYSGRTIQWEQVGLGGLAIPRNQG